MGSTMEAPLWVQLLGPVRAWRGTEEIDLGSARRRAVFAILAASADRAVSRAELVDGIWGDAPPVKAVGILHTYISDLRKALEPRRSKRGSASILTTLGSSYSLLLRPDQLDEQRFERHQKAAQRHWGNGNLQAAVDTLDAAIELWHGEGLDGLNVPFTMLYRVRLSEAKATALERRAALKLILGRHVEATGDLTDMVAKFALRESARGLLMVALYKSGRRAEALDLFTETQDVLVTGLGLDPGPALQWIHRKILHNEPLSAEDIGSTTWMPRQAAPSVRSLAALDSAHPVVPQIFVGRQRELKQLTALLAELSEGHGACAWVEGEAGIGKTALVAMALVGVGAGHRVIWARGNQLAATNAAASQANDFSQLLIATEQACVQGSVVLVVEDIHCGGDPDLLVWTRLSRLTRHLPLLLVTTCRTFHRKAEIVHLRNSVRMADGHLVPLDPLTSNDVAELSICRLVESFTPTLLPLLRIAAGNPGHVNDLLDAVVTSGISLASVGQAEVERTIAAVATGIAIQRLNSLDPGTQDVLYWAALLGVEFYPGDLTKIMRVSPAALADAIKEATLAGVLLEKEDSLAFRDEAVRLKLLDDGEDGQQTIRYRDAAETLADAGAPVERVAAQLLLAVPPVDPWAYRWLLANVDNVGLVNPGIATELLSRGIASRSLTVAQREQLSVLRIRMLCLQEQDPRDEVIALLATTKNVEHAGEMRWILAHLDYHAGAVDHAIADLRAAGHDKTVPAHWKARLLAMRAQFERETFDDVTIARETATEALRQAGIAGDMASTADALSELWYVENTRLDHPAALRHVDRALSITAGAPGHAERRVVLLYRRFMTLDRLDRLFEASATLAQMRSLTQRNLHMIARHHVATAAHYYSLGRWDEAAAELGQVIDGLFVNATSHRLHTVVRYHGVAALISIRRGDTATAWKHLRAADAYPIKDRGDQDASSYLFVARAIATGADEGLRHLDPLLDLSYGEMIPRYHWLQLVVRLGLQTGDEERVRAALEVCEEMARREVEPGRARTALRWCQALVNSDPDGLLAVARRFMDVGRPVDTADALVDAATALAASGKTGLAHLTFRDALSIYTELGASFDIKRAEAAMSAHGVHQQDDLTQQPMVPGWHSLSDIERLITKLVAVGRTTPEISAELTLPRRDVQWHISHIIQKLGLRSRSELEERMARASDTPDEER